MAKKKRPQGGESVSQPKAVPQLKLLGHYIKDLSFESPSAPGSFHSAGHQPNLQLGINLNVAVQQEDSTYEVMLSLTVRTHGKAALIWSLELLYGGLFEVRNLPPEVLHRVLLVDCPTILFPVVRRVVADITRDGGFTPVMLDPVDFGRLYAQEVSRAKSQSEVRARNLGVGS
jgi:preprotein translocase subunit SecB